MAAVGEFLFGSLKNARHLPPWSHSCPDLARSTALLSLLLMWTPPKAGSGLCFHDLVLRFGLHGRCPERNICKEALEMPTWIAPHSVDSVGTTLGSQWLVQALPARAAE